MLGKLLVCCVVAVGWALPSVGFAVEEGAHHTTQWVAKKKPAKKEKKAKKGKAAREREEAAPQKASSPPAPSGPTKVEALDLNAAPPPPAPSPAGQVLDLSAPPPSGVDENKAKNSILAPQPDEKKGGKKGKGGKASIDFGGGMDFGGGGGSGSAAPAGGDGLSFDFGGKDDSPVFDLGALNAASAQQRDRFEGAMSMMADEDYQKAALEFHHFLTDQTFADFQPEAQYQLGKALYKMGFFGAAHGQFQTILETGPTHKRYRKAVEWLFFMSRKVADQTPVLAELAKFRNVTFPKAYRNEYNYLLSKYLFVQADNFEVKRIEDEELARGKKSKEATIDFGVVADAISDQPAGAMDFGGGSAAGGGGAMDFGGGAAAMDFGKAASLDFGGGGGAMDFGAPAGGGGMDFGAPAAGGGGGGSLDFGAPAAPAGGGGMDFGAPAAGGGGGGSLDFSNAGDAQQKATKAYVQSTAPTNMKEAVKQGLDLVGQVGNDSTFYPRAKYLTGLLFYLNGDDQKAVESFQEVVRVLNPREGGARLDPKLREMAFLSLARIHYGYKQFNRSVYYYDLIDRDSENWLTALFEASWAYYRRGDFEKALGNLLTLHSPFFEREYFPESQIVKAIIYFEACRYPETREIVDDFIKRFTQLMREMQKVAESKDAPELLYERIEQLQKESEKSDDDVTARVVNLTLASPEIRTARRVVQQVDDQRKMLSEQMTDKFKQSALGSQLTTDLAKQSLDVSRAAGETTRKEFEQQLYKLKSLLAQALRIKIEVARSERELLEKKMQHEKTHDELIQAAARTVVDDEHVYWPYEGEYWRDELGTYELDFSMCKQTAQD